MSKLRIILLNKQKYRKEINAKSHEKSVRILYLHAKCISQVHPIKFQLNIRKNK